jgi:hypothetical protein
MYIYSIACLFFFRLRVLGRQVSKRYEIRDPKIDEGEKRHE